MPGAKQEMKYDEVDTPDTDHARSSRFVYIVNRHTSRVLGGENRVNVNGVGCAGGPRRN